MLLNEKARFAYLAPFRLPTGFAQAARENLIALSRAGLPICGKDTALPNLSFFLRREIVYTHHELNELIDPPEGADPAWYNGPFEAMILHTTGDVVRPMGVPTFAYLVWEVEGLPPGWAEAANTMDGVFTSSEFSKQLFVKGGVTKPVHVIPHAVDVTLFNPDVPAMTMTRERPQTVFLAVAQWMPRKGMEDLLVAYLTEFTKDDSVALALFTWGGSHSLAERENLKNRIQSIRDGLNMSDQPPIWFIGQNIPREAIPEIYAASDVLVSASRGEAFSLPIFEAAACGKPSISTGYGGQWDYLTEESAYKVDYTMEPVSGVGGNFRFYNGRQFWARINLIHLRQQMRRAHEEKTEREQRGQAALEIVFDQLTHEKIGEEMKARFLEHVESKVPAST